MRVTGLIRILNNVRARLAVGIAVDERARFKKHVSSVVRQVEELCGKAGTTPDSLPGASRNAYYFLKGLDLDNLPTRSADAPPAQGKIKIKNVTAIGEELAVRMWSKLDLLTAGDDNGSLFTLLKDLTHHAEKIESICNKSGLTVSHLELPTRQVYCWMKFLTDTDNLARHLMALSIAKAASRQYADKQRPLVLYLINTSVLWRMRRYSDMWVIKASEGFMAADQNVWRALLNAALASRPDNPALIKEFSRSEEYSGVLGEMESLAAPVYMAKGHAHDLDESFARVNAAYFNNSITRPGLRWSSVLTSRKFGHYQINRDAIMLSATLDSPKVPAFVVDFVMYHELLHKVHGVVWNGNRAMVHTPEFKRAERQFQQYKLAEAFISKLAREQRIGTHDELAKTMTAGG